MVTIIFIFFLFSQITFSISAHHCTIMEKTIRPENNTNNFFDHNFHRTKEYNFFVTTRIQGNLSNILAQQLTQQTLTELQRITNDKSYDENKIENAISTWLNLFYLNNLPLFLKARIDSLGFIINKKNSSRIIFGQFGRIHFCCNQIPILKKSIKNLNIFSMQPKFLKSFEITLCENDLQNNVAKTNSYTNLFTLNDSALRLVFTKNSRKKNSNSTLKKYDTSPTTLLAYCDYMTTNTFYPFVAPNHPHTMIKHFDSHFDNHIDILKSNAHDEYVDINSLETENKFFNDTHESIEIIPEFNDQTSSCPFTSHEVSDASLLDKQINDLEIHDKNLQFKPEVKDFNIKKRAYPSVKSKKIKKKKEVSALKKKLEQSLKKISKLKHKRNKILRSAQKKKFKKTVFCTVENHLLKNKKSTYSKSSKKQIQKIQIKIWKSVKHVIKKLKTKKKFDKFIKFYAQKIEFGELIIQSLKALKKEINNKGTSKKHKKYELIPKKGKSEKKAKIRRKRKRRGFAIDRYYRDFKRDVDRYGRKISDHKTRRKRCKKSENRSLI